MLTENLILQKTKQQDLRHVKKLNVCGVDLTDISILRYAVNLEVCSLSVNRVRGLEALSHCAPLQELYLRKNDISALDEVLHLSKLRSLRYLWLAENPCCQLPNYRAYVLRACPYLTKLDDQIVTDEERGRLSYPHGQRKTSTSPPPTAPVVVVPHARHVDPSSQALRGPPPPPPPPPPARTERQNPPPTSSQGGGGASSFNRDDVPVGSRPAARRPMTSPPRTAATVKESRSTVVPSGLDMHALHDYGGTTREDKVTTHASSFPYEPHRTNGSESVADIARMYGVGEDDVRAANPGALPPSTRAIAEGAVLKIPRWNPPPPRESPTLGGGLHSNQVLHNQVLHNQVLHSRERGGCTAGPTTHSPEEEAVFRAVLLLLGELSAGGLAEVRAFIDGRDRLPQGGHKR